MTFRQCAALSKIVNSTLLTFYAPSQIIKGSLLLDEYAKYLHWYKKLPPTVSSTENAPAHVLSLQYVLVAPTSRASLTHFYSMYYHVAVLLLFRPFLRARFPGAPEVNPADICRQAATAISNLFAKHMSLYGTTGIHTLHIQCLLAACTIHLINLPAIAASKLITSACNFFFRLVTRNTWAYGSVRLIRDLVRKWNIILPVEVEMALYPPHEDLPPGTTSRFDDPTAPSAQLESRQRTSSPSSGAAASSPGASKRAAFLNPTSHLMQKRQRLAPVHPSSASGSAVAGFSSGADVSPGAGTSDSGAESGKEEERAGTTGVGKSTVLFAPFPNQPAPLLGPIHTTTTPDPGWNEDDVVNRVTQDFDGLKFEGDGWFDPFIGI
jgi:hypothetical protein